MADNNQNSSGAFGGVEFNEKNKSIENTSYFEGTFGKDSTNNEWENSWQQKDNTNIWGNTQNSSKETDGNTVNNNVNNFEPIKKDKAITKQGLWSRVKAFLFQEIDLTAPIKIELTPYQQKVENEINEFLHQEVSFKGIVNFFKKGV